MAKGEAGRALAGGRGGGRSGRQPSLEARAHKALEPKLLSGRGDFDRDCLCRLLNEGWMNISNTMYHDLSVELL